MTTTPKIEQQRRFRKRSGTALDSNNNRNNSSGPRRCGSPDSGEPPTKSCLKPMELGSRHVGAGTSKIMNGKEEIEAANLAKRKRGGDQEAPALKCEYTIL